MNAFSLHCDEHIPQNCAKCDLYNLKHFRQSANCKIINNPYIFFMGVHA